jgi:ubiquinone/menaquinone biosynthesis C-methylase UbiE
MENERNRVCPVGLANSLDGKIRRLLQNPRTILSPYVREGMTVLDIGCGPGFFSIELAQMVGGTGRVISADLQEEMLGKLRDKIRGTELERRITLVTCVRDNINVFDKIDFGLAFFMVHEVPDKRTFFKQLKSIVNDKGQILFVEPKLFHVSQRDFGITNAIAEREGFKTKPGPRLPFSWSAVLTNE